MIRFWLLACSVVAGASVLPGASNSFLIARLRVMPEQWKKEANLQKIEHLAREAAAQGAHSRACGRARRFPSADD